MSTMIRLVFAGYANGNTALLAVRPELSLSSFAGSSITRIIPHI